jgi:cell division protein FtsW
MDRPLLAVVFALVCLGLIMVYSSSTIWAQQHLGRPLYFFNRQLLWATIGTMAMVLTSWIDYGHWREWIAPIFVATAIGLVWALVSSPVAGVRRWVHLGPIGVEPAEFAKFTSVLFLAYYLDKKRSKTSSALKGFVVPLATVMVLIALIAREPDLGTPILMFVVSLLLLFIGGTRLRYILGGISCAIPAVVYELFRYSYRRQRLLNFLKPFQNERGSGYQLAQALMAVGSGGLFGKGIGASRLKLMYLPAPHTDFIFPIICEELGLIGALSILALFTLLFVRGMRIAKSAPNLFGTLLATGITMTICLQAFFNIGMSIGLLPTKGIPLPFISFGGSSLLATLAEIGVLLNISKQSES